MNRNVLQQAERYAKKRKKYKLWQKIVTGLGSVVVFVTTYLLILPAITLETDAFCGIEEHVHDDSCYVQVVDSLEPVLICTAESQTTHIHTDECYVIESGHTHSEVCFRNTRGALICTLPEEEGHAHGEGCYVQGETLICDIPENHIHEGECFREGGAICAIEENHVHGDACMPDGESVCAIPEGHVHGDECFPEPELVCTITEGHIHESGCFEKVLQCTLEEKEGHRHSDECFEIVSERICTLEETEDAKMLICTIPEIEEHVHDETCYEASPEPELTCTLPEDENHSHSDRCYGTWEMACGKEEHSHVKACYSDPSADRETADDWEATFADVELTGNWAKDILAIAESQLGYHESTKNYIVLEDGESTKGYTRYGEWYGDPYGDWCAMFVSFCLHYAGVEDFPLDDNCADWLAELLENGLFAEPGEGDPVPGDLIFFDWQGDGKSDHIGFVVEYIPATNGSVAKVRTIEGNSGNRVEFVTYDAADPDIMGYGLVIQQVEASGAPYSLIHESGAILYHLPSQPEYQYSSHRVNDLATMNYVLIPEEILEGWVPNTLEWSEDADANYVVAYSVDHGTELKSERTSYTTYRIEDTEYREAAGVMEGIIGRSYPYITAEEMRQELSDAYVAGEIPMDLSCCTESDYIAAIQWAIWDASGKTGSLDTVTLAEFPSYHTGALNPLTDVGHTDPETMQSHVKAIRDWLMTKAAPMNLQIAGHESIITANSDGTYDIVATVTLDRPLGEQESITGTFAAGEKSSSFEVAEAGVQEFEITLNGVTAGDALRAEAKLDVNVSHMQVYIYDSSASQDMISGQWGEDSYELSFVIEAETTDVEVTKHWADPEIGAESIQVQLYANGEKYGEPVSLSEANNWKYIWDNLLKYNSEGETIDYTVAEELVPAYYSEVKKLEGGSQIITAFDAADVFAEGETYLLTYTGSEGAVHALADASGDGDPRLEWNAEVDLSDVDSVPDTARWIASEVSLGGTNAYLKNKSTGNYLSYDGNAYMILSEDASMKTHFLNKHLYFLNGDENRYLLYLQDGVGHTTNAWNDENVLLMNLYKETRVTETTAEISYLITNTKTTENTEISVKKEWAGREFGTYPSSVEVYLLRNGERYGDGITLNEENGWYYRWEELPLKIDDTLFTYTVEEAIVNDYMAEIVPSVEDDGTLIFTITNTWKPDYVLPETGGTGTQMYTLGGLLLMAAAIGLLLYRKKYS